MTTGKKIAVMALLIYFLGGCGQRSATPGENIITGGQITEAPASQTRLSINGAYGIPYNPCREKGICPEREKKIPPRELWCITGYRGCTAEEIAERNERKKNHVR